jgi:putative transposase
MTRNNQVNKRQLSDNMGISRSSLYYKPILPAKDLALKTKIEEVLQEHPAYGHKRISMHLCVNKKRILRVMKLFNLSPSRKPKVPVKSMDLGQEVAKYPNLSSDYALSSPSQIWSSDFTYLPYMSNKFIYLATILDCFTKEIISWNLSVKHSSDFIIDTLLDGLSMRSAPQIFHSDQGSEYKCHTLNKLLQSNGIRQSMSAKSSPWQNGMQESFYGKFKLELGHPQCYSTLGELTEAIAHQIYYYNNKRIHTSLKCPPNNFYKEYQIVQNNLC